MGLALASSCLSTHAATLAQFNFTSGSLASTADPIPGITISAIASDSTFLSFTSSTGWDSAAQISGASLFFSNPTSHSAAANAVYFTVTAADGYSFSLDGFGFLARSTATAPSDIGFRINSYSYDYSEAYSNNSTITSISNPSLGLTGLKSATVSIQGWNSGNSGALQLDNVVLLGTVIPEPPSILLLMFGTLVLLRRQR
jgi:hypothetical protein